MTLFLVLILAFETLKKRVISPTDDSGQRIKQAKAKSFEMILP
jgi:hypothetical protein